MKKRYTIRGACAALVSGAMVLGVSAVANAVEQDRNAVSATIALDGDALSVAEEEQLAADLEILFTRYVQLLPGDSFTLNEANLREDGEGEQIAELQLLVDGLNRFAENEASMNSIGAPGLAITPLGVGDFAKCVALEGLGIPAAQASPGLVAAIKEGISAWNWGLTARSVAKILGTAAVKALGGPVGIGISLGWAAWSCRGKL